MFVLLDWLHCTSYRMVRVVPTGSVLAMTRTQLTWLVIIAFLMMGRCTANNVMYSLRQIEVPTAAEVEQYHE
jgi:hypothetical protein